MPQGSTDTAGSRPLRVFYDGACPLCRAEIALYRRKADDAEVAFVDISKPDAPLPRSVDRDAALARFHVEAGESAVRSGAAAFAELWSRVDGWRGLGRVARLPVVRPVLEGAYRLFLRLRPLIVALFVRLRPGDAAGR